MNALYLLLAITLPLALVLWAWRKQRVAVKRSGRLPYVLRPNLFTPCEQRFLAVLHELYDDRSDVDIYGKVRLADLFAVTYLPPSENARAFGAIAQKHVDFVIVERATTRPIIAIELDDASHDRVDRVVRDEFVDRVFASAGLAMVHVKAAGSYNAGDVRALIRSGGVPAKPSLLKRFTRWALT